MTTTFTIIPAQEAILPSLIGLWRERMTIISQTVPHLSHTIETDEAHLDFLKMRLAQAQCYLVYANTHTGAIGYILGNITEGAGIIEEMALDAHAYHHGLGKALVTALRDYFSAHAISCVFVRAPRYYAVEQAFWRAMGAKEQKEIAWKTHPLYIWMALPSDPP